MSILESYEWRGLAMLALIAEARRSQQHAGLYGENNETLLSTLLQSRLPTRWTVSTGEILDAEGCLSPQCDIIIHDSVHYPAAYASSSGKVAVFAHAVGAVIEVKSHLHSGSLADPDQDGDVEALGKQMSKIHSFLRDAHVKAKSARNLPDQLSERLPLVYGFAYSSSVQEQTIEDSLSKSLSGEYPARAFVLDVPRAAIDVKAEFTALGQAPTLPDILVFTERLRKPHGFAFHRDLLGTEWVVSKMPTPLGCLNNLVKELIDEIRTSSPIGVPLSDYEYEVVHSAYHAWTGLYGT